MRIDPYKHKERYLNWKNKLTEKGIEGVSKPNSDLILRYINDMEIGINVANHNKKGARSYVTLNNVKQRLCFMSNLFESKLKINCMTDLKEENLFQLFNDMRNGTIKRVDGTDYLSVVDYIRVFKAFWHWWQKVNKKSNIEIKDITLDLDTRKDKPKWVYLTEQEVKQLCDGAKYKYRVLFTFLFDSGIRSPTELLNVRVSDLFNNCKELNIREEASKTFGRRIKLMLCGDLIKEYIQLNKLEQNDVLFDISHLVANRYLKRLAGKLFGDNPSPAGAKYSQMTMYDFRHISCCYWLPRYKSESALKYRFGWKKSDKIHYYSELLGMKDTISEDDMLVDLTKTEIEKRLEKSENEKFVMGDRLKSLEQEMSELRRVALELIEHSKVVAR